MKKFNQVINMFIIIMALSVIHPLFSVQADSNHEENTDSIIETLEDIIDWKKSTNDVRAEDALFDQRFLAEAGETAGDWYVIGMGRLGYEDDYAAYLAVIKDIVQERYQEEHKLSKAKATEWHRISLAILAAGGDPTNVGTDSNNQAINLIADGTYNRGDTRSLGTQGINGWIWGLITLDSLRYEVPEDAADTRKDIIKQILKTQLSDGGFSLNSPRADADITAMALQALAPYYNSEETFTYKQDADNKKVTRTVREVVDEALTILSELQLADGDYKSMDTSNLESTAQVMVALTSLGIDPLEDERFIKEDNTLVDGMLLYAQEDGGFVHAKAYDEENPTSKPDESNTMASEQALYALTSLVRFNEGYRNLYDFREEMTNEEKEKIKTIEHAIERIPKEITQEEKEEVQSLFESYLQIPVEERPYVSNYDVLADAMEILEMDNTSEPLSEHMEQKKDGEGMMVNILHQEDQTEESTEITEADETVIEHILDEDTSTEHYVDVVRLLDKLDASEEKEIIKEYKSDVEEEKIAIEDLELKLEEMNQTILRQLYPFDDIGVKDKDTIDDIMEQYDSLSEYDQEKVEGYNDVEKAETQINNLIRARYIMIAVGLVIVAMSVLLIVRVRKRKREKQKEMMMDIE